MRSLFAVLAVVALSSACSDDKQPTSPAAARPSVGVRSDASTKNGVSEANGMPQAKPTDEVGFTTVSFHQGEVLTVSAGVFVAAYATCPVGKASISGGYQLISSPVTAPLVATNYRTTTGDQTGWVVGVDNTRAGAGTVKVVPYVLCIS